jgi:4-oxalomesaconate tautomerase
VAAPLAALPAGNPAIVSVEHPSGETSCVIECDAAGTVIGAAMLRTARK